MARFSLLVFVCLLIQAGQVFAQQTVATDSQDFNPQGVVGQTMAAAQQSGMPVITLGLSESCGFCKKLVEQLKNDPVTAQFIVLPMDTVNNPNWNEWTQKYKPLGPNVPVMFIVRADGQQLQMMPGLPEGDGVATILRAALAKAGKPLDAAQAKRMNSALTKAKGAYKAKKLEAAISALVPISGSGSYAAMAIETEALLAEIIKEADQQIEAAEALLKEPEQALQGAVQLLAANRLYGRIPAKKESLETLVAKYTQDEATKSIMEQAQLLSQAEVLLADRKKDEAVSSLQSIVQDFPGSAAAEMATARMAELKTTSTKKSTSTVSTVREVTPQQNSLASGKLRMWSDTTGRFKIEATLESHTADKVTLKKADGTLTVVPLAKLSPADRKFVADKKD